MAETKDDKISGRMSAFNIRRKISPRKFTYIICRSVQLSFPALRQKPSTPPSTTPAIVRIVSRFERIHPTHLFGLFRDDVEVVSVATL